MSIKQALKIKNLYVSRDNTPVVKGVSLGIGQGETHILMGPNGSGKSTLLAALVGLEHAPITKGTIRFGHTDITAYTPEKRAHLGFFLGFQHPPEIPGVSIATMLRHANVGSIRKQKKIDIASFAKKLRQITIQLGIDHGFVSRTLNEGFSGGERKKSEILQLLMLEPRFAFLDEIDSGLDVDALSLCVKALRDLQIATGTSYLFVTHNPGILTHIHPTRVHIMIDGRIVKSGGDELIRSIEIKGFEQFITQKK